MRHKNSPTQGDRRGHPCTHICTQTSADVQRETNTRQPIRQVIPIPSQLETLFSCKEKKEKMEEISHATLLFLNVCESRHEMQTVQAWLPLYMCFPHVSILCSCMSLHPHRLSLSPFRDLSPACASSYPQNAKQIHPPPPPPPQQPSLPHHPRCPYPQPLRHRKEQESIEMNGQACASWLELNGNVKLTADPFCLSVEGRVSLGSPNRIIPSH